VVFALRDVTQAGPRGAVSATFDRPRARYRAGSGDGGAARAVTSIGKRSPTVYAGQRPAAFRGSSPPR